MNSISLSRIIGNMISDFEIGKILIVKSFIFKELSSEEGQYRDTSFFFHGQLMRGLVGRSYFHIFYIRNRLSVPLFMLLTEALYHDDKCSKILPSGIRLP